MLKRILLISFILFVFINAQDSIVGTPYRVENNLSIDVRNVKMPFLDVISLKEEDTNQIPGRPFRYGYKFDVNYTLNNSGIWTTLENGDRIWSLSIHSEDAYALSCEYSQFYLPEGSMFYVFSEDYDVAYGAYTNNNNQEDMLFSTPLVKGDYLYLEYYEPEYVYNQGIIDIDFIIHDYTDILGFFLSQEDRTCGDNVVCDSADPYEDQINATSFLDMGGYICSGSMVNNTSFDLTPYYWTAWHCVVNENISTFRFYFDYETSTCSGSWGSQGVYEYGGNLLSDSGGMDPDYALILITDSSISDGIYYAGWDQSSSSPSIACGVHHPGGDPKKINFDNGDTAYNSGSVNWGDPDYDGDNDISPAGSHWRITWDEGGTEGGSSGSPAYNTAGRLIGQLTGGSGSCNSSGQDYYGKFSRAFDDVDTWLDPLNTNPSYIDGTYEGLSDSDGDGVSDDSDSNENNPYECSDVDLDTCDDCSTGTFDPSDDGWDYDGDGLCDAGDSDDDNDGVEDSSDSDDNNEFACSDSDGDSCDDCAYGWFDPENDGCIYMSGDVNLDNIINIIDVVMLVNIILGGVEPSPAQEDVADLNNDGNINISDIILLVTIILQ